MTHFGGGVKTGLRPLQNKLSVWITSINPYTQFSGSLMIRVYATDVVAHAQNRRHIRIFTLAEADSSIHTNQKQIQNIVNMMQFGKKNRVVENNEVGPY